MAVNDYNFKSDFVVLRNFFLLSYEKNQYTDCILKCNSSNDLQRTAKVNISYTDNHNNTSIDNQINAHRILLSAFSDYFQSTFASIPNNNKVVIVCLNNIDFDILESIIHYIYKGEITVSPQRIQKFSEAAKFFKIKDLLSINILPNHLFNNDKEMEIQRLKIEKTLLEKELSSLRNEIKNKEVIELQLKEFKEPKNILDYNRNKVYNEKKLFEKIKFTNESPNKPVKRTTSISHINVQQKILKTDVQNKNNIFENKIQIETSSSSQVYSNTSQAITNYTESDILPINFVQKTIESKTNANEYNTSENLEIKPKWIKSELLNRYQKQQTLEDLTKTSYIHQSTFLLNKCPFCQQIYRGNQVMQDHINSRHYKTGKKYSCIFCDKVYSWLISLNSHIKRFHQKNE